MAAQNSLGTPLQPSSEQSGSSLFQQLLRFTWGDFTDEEKALHRHIRVTDYIGFIVIAALYLAAAWCAGLSAAIQPPPPSPKMTAAQSVFAAWGLYTLHLHVYCQPNPKNEAKTAAIYNCLGGPCGRWIFLTRQTIGLQAMHLITSALAPFCSMTLTAGTYALAVYVGGQASFVTIQFFTLVFPQAEYKAACDLWASRGVYFKLIGKLTHVPGACLMFVDICLLKERHALLSLTLPDAWLLLILLCYTCLYLLMLFANHRITAEWPYSFLYKFNLFQWVKFFVVQYGILVILTSGVLALSWYFPVSW